MDFPLEGYSFRICFFVFVVVAVPIFFRFWLLAFLPSWLLGFLASWLFGFPFPRSPAIRPPSAPLPPRGAFAPRAGSRLRRSPRRRTSPWPPGPPPPRRFSAQRFWKPPTCVPKPWPHGWASGGWGVRQLGCLLLR